MLEFEWSEDKRLANAQKHKIDFADAVEIFKGEIMTVEDDRFDYGERRFITIGLLRGHVIAVTHTERNHLTRIISARKATRYEQITYFEQFPH